MRSRSADTEEGEGFLRTPLSYRNRAAIVRRPARCYTLTTVSRRIAMMLGPCPFMYQAAILAQAFTSLTWCRPFSMV